MNPPGKLKKGGRGAAAWKRLTENVDFDDLEVELLSEFCAILDTLDALPADAYTERRQQQVVLSRIAGQLALPTDGGSSTIAVGGRSVRARAAANARWRKEP